jgi:UDP-N-acetylmuramoyl-tripeptide--D-alanyl-D-alanine ligase
VPDTRRALLELATEYRARQRATVVGITGSNGKTTTKDLLGCMLSAHGKTVVSQRSFNNDIGLPLTLLELERDTRYAAVEMGTSGAGEIATLARAPRAPASASSPTSATPTCSVSRLSTA